jgi:alpha-1,2-mannosyltransferase
MSPRSWLTARRVRVHGLLLAVSVWTVYAVDMSRPGLLDRYGLVKGTDFLHFYTLGTLASRDRGDLLYDMRAQAELAREWMPQRASNVYVPLYGPQVSLVFAPLARLSYGWALTAWLALNVLMYGFCCYAVWKTCPNLQEHPWTVLILAIAFPGFFHLLLWGQTSGLALLCFTLAYLAWRRDQKILAGLAIGSLIFKPQLGLTAAIVFVCTQEWKAIFGALLAAAAQLAAAWMHYGEEAMRAYFHALTNLESTLPLLEPRLYQTHSLRAFWSLLIPWPHLALGLYVITALGVLLLAVESWKGKAALEIRYAALLIASVLVSPHLTVYDLVILAPAFLLLGDWGVAHRDQSLEGWLRVLLYACYSLFLLGPLSRIIHLQMSVVALTALLGISWRIVKQQSTLSA